MVGRHNTDDDLCVAQGFRQAICGFNCVRNRAAGEKQLVDVMGIDALANLGFVCPDANMMSAVTSEDDSDGSTPSSCSNDGNATHAALVFPPPRRFSLPAMRRRMLSLWRMMINRDEADMRAKTVGLRVSGLSHQAAMGKTAEPTILPKETKRVMATIATNSNSEIATAAGAMPRKAPTAVATPLPPLKRSQRGNMWPTMAQRPARAASW